MPINHEEIMTYTDKHIRRKIIVIEYLLHIQMQWRQCVGIDISIVCQGQV
jgi:hypothetical protein